jgi:hypothetical protein
VTDTKTIAFVLYPGITPLDMVGPLQALSVFAAFDPGYQVAVVPDHVDPHSGQASSSR